ncbi:MAG: hypothetical protein QM759_04205 [Terricaulis sp.]
MKRLVAVAALLGLALAEPALAQTQLFSDSTPVRITVSAPLSTLIQRAPRSTDPFPGTVTLNGGAPHEFPIQLNARGVTRRIAGICNFPPLRIDFDDHVTHGTLFEGQDKLKLVDPCKQGDSFQQLVVLEYLAYRLYNVITPVSYRVRPVQVTFHDTDRHRGDTTNWGYLIEDIDDVAHRNHLHAMDALSNALNASQLDGAAASRFALFEYMISNLDWDMVAGHPGEQCCHNSKLVGATANATANAIPVPYDFDYSGLVNAPYAVPPEGLRVNNVRTRFYRGYCRYNDDLANVITEFRQHKAELFSVVDNEQALQPGRRQSAHAYLQDFFDILDDPAAVQRNLTEHCRGG